MSRRRRPSRKVVSTPPKPVLFVPFGIKGLKTLIAKCKGDNILAENALLVTVIDHLKLNHYTDKDIEWVLENDNLADQVNTWVEKNRTMLSLGQGGVYGTLKFSVSPPEVVGS